VVTNVQAIDQAKSRELAHRATNCVEVTLLWRKLGQRNHLATRRRRHRHRVRGRCPARGRAGRVQPPVRLPAHPGARLAEVCSLPEPPPRPPSLLGTSRSSLAPRKRSTGMARTTTRTRRPTSRAWYSRAEAGSTSWGSLVRAQYRPPQEPAAISGFLCLRGQKPRRHIPRVATKWQQLS
jgi:hypothetical protein